MKKVKNWVVGALVSMLVFCAVPVYSQTSFLTGLVFGAILFGDGDQTGTSSAVIYQLVDVSKRVENPLEIRMVSIRGDFEYNNAMAQLRYWDIFTKAVAAKNQDPRKFEILQIMRVFRGDAPEQAAIWFAYIEKEKVRSSAQK